MQKLMKGVISVGLVHINEGQTQLLKIPTARQYNACAGFYVGVLEVLHQSHCLVSEQNIYRSLLEVNHDSGFESHVRKVF